MPRRASAAVRVKPAEPEAAARQDARAAGLRHVTDGGPGIRRRRAGKGFVYVGAGGARITDAGELARIRALAIPPAWTHVWICPTATGHLQATGRDAKGRKQYRYHKAWREVRDETKYDRMRAFGAVLPLIRERASKDLSLPGLPRAKVLATVVALLERTLIRVGNEEYARKNASFGLTTLQEQHVLVEGTHLQFHFRGKSGKEHVIDVRDRRLAAIVRRCQDLPGQELFHFRDESGALHAIESADVNAYLRDAAGDHFTAKDFRTWHGTLLTACALASFGVDVPPTKRRVADAVKEVAARLGNTPTVCRQSYIHPAVVSRYLRGQLVRVIDPATEPERREAALLALLEEEERAARAA